MQPASGTGSLTITTHDDRDITLGLEGSWDRDDWQRIWFRTRSRDWRTLALVPGDDCTSTFHVANLISKLALDHGESVRVADLRALRPRHVDGFLETMRRDVGQGTRIVFATRAVSTNAATVPLARAADCAILCVSLGSTSLTSVRDTIEQVGRKHFLGSFLVRAAAESAKTRRALSQRGGPKVRR